jgi:hypothetical protein
MGRRKGKAKIEIVSLHEKSDSSYFLPWECDAFEERIAANTYSLFVQDEEGTPGKLD